MLHLVLATARPKAMQAFAEALASDPAVNLQRVVSGAEALEAARTAALHLVIIDVDLPDTAPLDLVQKLLMVMPKVGMPCRRRIRRPNGHPAADAVGWREELEGR